MTIQELDLLPNNSHKFDQEHQLDFGMQLFVSAVYLNVFACFCARVALEQHEHHAALFRGVARVRVRMQFVG